MPEDYSEIDPSVNGGNLGLESDDEDGEPWDADSSYEITNGEDDEDDDEGE